jgi:hypothetical protein
MVWVRVKVSSGRILVHVAQDAGSPASTDAKFGPTSLLFFVSLVLLRERTTGDSTRVQAVPPTVCVFHYGLDNFAQEA